MPNCPIHSFYDDAKECPTCFPIHSRKDPTREAMRRGFDLAIQALKDYRPESEEVRACMHSPEWASWLEEKRTQVFKGEIDGQPS